MQGPYCRDCQTNAGCPEIPGGGQQVACGDDKMCDFTCTAVRDPSGCNADGSFTCSVEVSIPPTGPACNAGTQHFHCGAMSGLCPEWMVCTDATGSGVCKVTGGRPCINNNDCYSGVCTSNVCAQNGLNAPCIGDAAGECPNFCGSLMINATQFKSVCN
jgi:hypothetical protein